MGWSAGLAFLNDGGAGNPAGSSGVASEIAVCTSTAAPSMSRSRSNCRRDLGVAGGTGGGHRIQAGDGGELPLQRRRHGRRHGGGIGSGQAHLHLDGGKIDARQIAHRQAAISHHAEQRDARHQQGWWQSAGE